MKQEPVSSWSGDTRLAVLVERMLSARPRVTATPAEVAFERHIDDALTGAAAIGSERPGPLVDVGAGGGIPGLALAIRFPERPVSLVEATGWKAAFLVAVAAELGLDNVTVHPERAEEHAIRFRDGYAIATARALAPPPVAAELCLPLVRQGGLFLLYAGAVDATALATVAPLLGAVIERIESVPGSAQRSLVLLRKVADTPEGFPRRPGMAAKRPLPPR